MNVSRDKNEKEDLGTLAEFITHPELYSYHIDEDLDWVIVKKKEKEIEIEHLLTAAKAFQKAIPILRDYTIRIKHDGKYHLMFDKVDEAGNLIGFEIIVPMTVS